MAACLYTMINTILLATAGRRQGYNAMASATQRRPQPPRLSTAASAAPEALLHHPSARHKLSPRHAACFNDADPAALLRHPAMWDTAASGSARRKLSPRHAADFGDAGALFDQVAHAVCRTGVLPRKELFETWAVALRIQAHFPEARRVADVASGHGLLAWMLLLLDEMPPSQARTAVCVDRRMPASADKLQRAMLAAFPRLDGRWQFIEADAAQVEPHPSCVLAAVHACGGLSDTLVALAIAARAPVALVPCCHTFKKWAPHALLLESGAGGTYAPFAAAEGAERQAVVKEALGAGERSAADFLDSARVAALRAAGFAVSEETIPEELTAKNRLLLARPPAAGGADGAESPSAGAAGGAPAWRGAPGERRPASPRLARPAEPPRLRVPLADDPASLAACAALSGRERADARKAAPPPALDLSVWLPPPAECGAQPLSAPALERLAERVCAAHGGVGVRVRALPLDIFLRSDGRRAQTFRIEYAAPRHEPPAARALSAVERRDAEAGARAAERERALEWHMALQEEHIAAEFAGAEVRGSELLARQRAERRARPPSPR